jgi:glycosyltransferase involved in cell wall biosynthesis
LIPELAKSACLVCPSEWYENNPRSVIEAFAVGLPVIGARIGGIPELVIDDETGYTFTPGDSEDLRKKILYLLNHPELRKKMGSNARKKAIEDYSQVSHYPRLMEAYESAIDARLRRNNR